MAETQSPPTRSQTFLRRTFSTLILWGIVGAAFGSMKPWAHLALIGGLAILATLEYFSLCRQSGLKYHPTWGLLLCIGYSAALSGFLTKGLFELPIEVDMMLFFLLIAGTFILQLRQPIEGTNTILSVTTTMLGVIWLTWMFYFTARIDFFIESSVPHSARVILRTGGCFRSSADSPLPGALLLLWCIAVTKFSDMGAYITGSLIGKHKMIPHISPAKTWEGFAGALLFSQLAACSLYVLFPKELAIFSSWTHVIILGFIVALLAVVGDLAESLWKRSLTVKDSGHFLPGIGGAMDLIDSICFTAPAVYLYVKFFL
jgi:phosphatidate cytidylyltransferase